MTSVRRRIVPELLGTKKLTRLPCLTSLHNKAYDRKNKATQYAVPSKMQAWYLTGFNGVDNLTMGEISVPAIKSPKDVLVKVKAASLNPLDTMMSKGYGEEVLSKLRSLSGLGDSIDSFPLVLGRDFSGEVVDVGMSVTEYAPGDEIWGAVFPSSQGALAEYVSTTEYSIYHKPKNLSHLHASSLPYVGLTAWSALSLTAQLHPSNVTKCNKVLVIGASGGVGTFAVQLLKAWNCQVVAICQDDAFEMISDLGADVVLDYKAPEFETQLQQLQGQFDVIFDCAGSGSPTYKAALKRWKNAAFVSLNSPVLQSTDKNGLVCGIFDSVKTLIEENILSFSSQGNTHRWGYFMTNPTALKEITKYVESGQIKPVIQEEFKMPNVPEAFQRLQSSGARGKIVIDLNT